MREIVKGWSASHIPTQSGKAAIVTGANSGIGYETALELGRAGADVVVACRDTARGQAALAKLQATAPGASFSLEQLDLADLGSVRSFAERFLQTGRSLDVLVNNAGVMALPKRELTVDGFERQIGTNHLGHFALTGLLLPALRRSPAPRVVSLSSGMAYIGKVNLADLQGERSYSTWGTYSASKLANLLFMEELGRRAPWLVSVGAHPGATRTNLQQHAGFFTALSMKLMGQEAPDGALPTLYAATDAVATGEFIGPSKLFHMNGSPTEVKLPKRAHDEASARALWEKSEELTSVRYDFSATPRASA